MMRKKIMVKFEIDLPSLNEYLGNTPTVTLSAAMSEYLTGMFGRDYSYCERCGSADSKATGIIGNFSIVETTVRNDVLEEAAKIADAAVIYKYTSRRIARKIRAMKETGELLQRKGK